MASDGRRRWWNVDSALTVDEVHRLVDWLLEIAAAAPTDGGGLPATADRAELGCFAATEPNLQFCAARRGDAVNLVATLNLELHPEHGADKRAHWGCEIPFKVTGDQLVAFATGLGRQVRGFDRDSE